MPALVALAVVASLALAAGGVSTSPAEAAVAKSPQSPRLKAPGPDRKPTAEGARAAARRSGERVEVGAFRAEDREVYANPDGSFTAVQHLRPVRSRTDGGWTAIDTTLKRRSDGSVAPVASSVDLVLSGGGDGPLVRMTRAGRSVALSWPGGLPEPTLDGDTATYADVLPGVDLLVRADVDGFSHLLVVKSRGAAQNPRLAELRYGLEATRLQVREDGSGGLRLSDTGAGGAVFEALPPTMWDSAGAADPQGVGPSVAGSVDPTQAAPPGSKVADVALSVDGGDLVLKPDQEMLTGDETEYPVYIDPEWHTVRASAWAMVSKGFPRMSYWKFKGTEGVGFCDVSRDGDCVRNQVKRIFYRMPTGFLDGRNVLKAEFVAVETHAFDCGAKRGVQLWHTKPFNRTSTWNSSDDNWKKRLRSRDVGYCSRTEVEFSSSELIDLVQKAAARGWNTVSFGLRASNESSMDWWKRFANEAFLRVQYNRPPKQPKMRHLSMSPGGGCAKRDSGHAVNKVPTLYARVFDPDREDRNKVYAQFQLSMNDGSGWEDLWTSRWIGPKTTGSIFQVRMPSSIPRNTWMEWHVRAWDKTARSPWSSIGAAHGCWFRYDPSVPAPPEVTSTDYPESNPADPNDPWYDGVGRYGQFTIDSAAGDATKYWYGLNADPTAAHEVRPDNPGGPVTIDVMPTEAGVNYLRVQTFDEAGNASAIGQYMFRVKAGRPARARWKLNEDAGSDTVVGAEAQDVSATLHGGATLGADGADGTALSLDGVDDYAATDGPVIRTDQSFSVSAWVRMASKPSDVVAVSQDGSVSAGFNLYYSSATNRWALSMYSKDTTDPSIIRVNSTDPPVLNQWTHLVGVYDAAAHEIRLFVNGTLADSMTYASTWTANGPLNIGRGKYNGHFGNHYFNGDIDDVRVFAQAISGAEVAKLHEHKPIAAPARAVWALNEESSATEIVGKADDFIAEPRGGAELGVQGIVGTALSLDGSNDYAATDGPLLRTDHSFAVSAWVRMAAKPSNAVVASQVGSVSAGFNLYYTEAVDGWALSMYSKDGLDPRIVRSVSRETPTLNEWTHLVGVYDDDAEEIRLYVNGELEDTTSYTSSWNAAGPFNIGRGIYNGSYGNKYFPGSIDDLRVFDRVVTAEEVRDLFTQHPVVVGRWKLNEASGSPATTPDDSDLGRDATLHGNAAIGEGWVGSGGLVLDGAGDYAATGGPVLDTGESFTVAGWAQTAGTPTRKAAVFSQAGDVNSGFVLRYAPNADGGNGGWQIEMPDADKAGAAHHTADHSSFQAGSEWNHLAIVYDAFQDQMRLYVNGQLEQTETDVSWRWNTIGFNARGGLQLGRSKSGGSWGEYWPGVLDDVWAFQGIATQQQIQQLANGTELPTGGSP